MSHFNSKTGLIDTEVCILTGDDLFNKYEGKWSEHEFIFALSDLVNPIELLKLEVGEALAFQCVRDVPEYGTYNIIRTN